MGGIDLRHESPPGFRYELKFVAPGAHGTVLRTMISSMARRDPEHASNRVHSIYYDTVGLESYRENLDGMYARSKTRVRWYGLPGRTWSFPTSTAWIEVKAREGSAGWKLRDEFRFEEPVRSQGELLRQANRAVVSRRGGGLVPVCWISYARTRYRGLHNDDRISVDGDVRGRWLHPSVAVPVPECALHRTIVEVKGGSDRPSPALVARLAGRARRRSFSKYSNVVGLLSGGVR